METLSTTLKKKSKSLGRLYKGSDADMLTSGLVLTDTALTEQPALAGRRSRITTDFLRQLRQDLAEALDKDLGIDPRLALQQATGRLTSVATKAKTRLVDFYQDLRDAYHDDKPRLNELRALLGFRDYYEGVRANNQQALSQLLIQFDTNLTPDILAELTDPTRGDIALQTITDIRAHVKFYELNVTQETLKSQSIVITRELVAKFNALYRRVMNVARLGRSIHRLNPAKAAAFSYSQVRRTLHGGSHLNPDDKTTT